MPKNFIQDMIVAKNENREKVQNKTKNFDVKNIKNDFTPPRYNPPHYDPVGEEPDRGKPKYKIWFIAIVSIVIFLFAFSFLFSKALITVNPKSKAINLNESFSAS